MEYWNFHNYIALPLEEYGKAYIGPSCQTADEIVCGEFVNSMMSILSVKFGALKEIPDFVDLCRAYVDIPASRIPQEKAIELFNEFKRLEQLCKG